MRRRIAHNALLTDVVGKNTKARDAGLGVPFAGRGKPFYSSSARVYLKRIEDRSTKPGVPGSYPGTRAFLFTMTSPSSGNYRRGHILGPKPKNEVVRPAFILADWLEESPDQNDLSQLPNRSGEGRILRSKQSPKV